MTACKWTRCNSIQHSSVGKIFQYCLELASDGVQHWHLAQYVGGHLPVSDDRCDGLSPAGPADVAPGGMPLATPPLTDGHLASEEAGLQVQFGVELARWLILLCEESWPPDRAWARMPCLCCYNQCTCLQHCQAELDSRKRLAMSKLGLQGTGLTSVGSDEHTKDSFTSRTKMVLSSLQTNFEAAAEAGSVKKRRLSSSFPHRLAPEVGCI